MSGHTRVSTDDIDAATSAEQTAGRVEAAVAPAAPQLPEMNGYTRVTTEAIDAAMSTSQLLQPATLVVDEGESAELPLNRHTTETNDTAV